jgi:hypothetical protein
MILPDANLILYAYDLESPFHTVAAAWWTKCLGEAEPVGLAQVILLLRPPIKKGIIDREPSAHSEREVIIKRLTPLEGTIPPEVPVGTEVCGSRFTVRCSPSGVRSSRFAVHSSQCGIRSSSSTYRVPSSASVLIADWIESRAVNFHVANQIALR